MSSTLWGTIHVIHIIYPVLCGHFQLVSPELSECLDDLQIVTEHTAVVMVTAEHEVLQQPAGQSVVLCACVCACVRVCVCVCVRVRVCACVCACS